MADMFILGVIAVLVGASDAASCPAGFEAHEDSCYLFSHGEETWIGAYDSCKLFYGSMLVEVTDALTDAYLSNRSAQLNSYFWIGLTDKLIEGEYEWATSRTSLYSQNHVGWGAGEPDGRDDENCVFYAGTRGYLWADADCTRKERYICQLSAIEGPDIIG